MAYHANRLELTRFVCSFYNLHVRRWIVSLDVGINGLLHHARVHLGHGQLTPYGWLIAALSKLVGAVQVLYVLYQYLEGRGRREEIWT